MVAGWRCGQRSVTSPDQHGAIFIHCKLFGPDDFGFQVFQVVLVEVEAAFECPVGHPPFTP